MGSTLKGILRRRAIVSYLTFLALTGAPPAHALFVTFESGQVRPLALSPDGKRLFAVNTPDNSLEVFAVASGGLTHLGAVPVGMEPVAVAARSNTEVWVVNHLSDSLSIVDTSIVPPRVTRTLLVGDEPRDIVFAGPGGNRAFITTAHRGQNSPVDPQLTTPGVGRADVWVFDASNLGSTLGGVPLTIVTLFGDTPRALAASPDGNTVYAAVFHSGNRTTAVSEGGVCNGGAAALPCDVAGSMMPGGLPAPNANIPEGTPGPETGLVVKFEMGGWRDRLGRDWSPGIRFTLPDKDVFAIDAAANPPVETSFFAHVGTVIFNMVTNPATGKVYVTNTEARNEVRFEGPGGGGSTVRGRLAEARVTVLDGATVTPRHLNPHIDYGVVPSPAGVKDDSLAIPIGMAVTGDGSRLYVTAFGSSKVGVFDTTDLETGSFVPDSSDHITVTGGGPSGLVLDEPRDRLYVFTRFDNAISVVDTTTNLQIAHIPVHNPEPPDVVAGRPFLYDAVETSSNGEASCAACHIFGDFDSLAWDLGNPDDVVLNDPNLRRVQDLLGQAFPDFHPLKGPMTTQSLRGMANHGPMHWRGDRTGGNDPGGDFLDEDAAFKKFNVAFGGLLGRSGPLTDPQMQAFTDFILQVTYPPNPIRALDNSLTTDQAAGQTFFFGPNSDVLQDCNGCHKLDPALGFFGSDGFMSFENEPQMVKIPHLRNLYQKVGMFGMQEVPFINAGNNGPQGDQVRGFGFLHDGSIDTLLRFHNATVFNRTNPGGLPIPNPGGFLNGAPGDPARRQVEQFMLAFDSNLKPIVGQQITLNAGSGTAVNDRIDLMNLRDDAGDCVVVAKGLRFGQQRGWQRQPDGTFQPDRTSEPLISDAGLRAQAAAGEERTFTCVPPGSGERIGVDRDEDGVYDRDELDAESDPADPNCFPPTCVTHQSIRGSSILVKDPQPNVDPSLRKLVIVAREVLSPNTVDGNPLANGATLTVNLSGASPSSQSFYLPPGAQLPGSTVGWKAVSGGFRYRDAAGANGPVKTFFIKKNGAGLFQLKAVAKGLNGLISVLPPTGGAAYATATLQIGGGDTYCVWFGGLGGGPVSSNTLQTFKVRNVTSEASCPS
jgi:YVTN family beta-propeller protein